MLLYYQKKLPVWQYVICVGNDPVRMDNQLQEENRPFSYPVLDMKRFPCQTFLDARRNKEVLLAVLADFGGEPEALVAEKIIAK